MIIPGEGGEGGHVKGWSHLTIQEKAEALGGTFPVLVYSENDPYVGIDYAGYPAGSTISMTQYTDMINNAATSRWVTREISVISGDASKWTGLTLVQKGVVTASGFLSDPIVLTRIVPSSYCTEVLRCTYKAYSDSGYVTLVGQNYTDFSFYFFSHCLGTILSFADFEGTYDGWTEGTADYGSDLTEHPMSGAYSVALVNSSGTIDNNAVNDSAAVPIPDTDEYIAKTVTCTGYTNSFLFLTVTNSETLALSGMIRIWTPTRDWTIKVLKADLPISIALPLGTISTTVLIKIAGLYDYSNGTYLNIDCLGVVGF